MPKYTTEPPVSGVFIPDVGSFNADAAGIFDLPDDPRVAVSLAAVGISLLPVVEDPAPAPPAGAGDAPAADQGAQGADAGEAAAEPAPAPAPTRTTRRPKTAEVSG